MICSCAPASRSGDIRAAFWASRRVFSSKQTTESKAGSISTVCRATLAVAADTKLTICSATSRSSSRPPVFSTAVSACSAPILLTRRRLLVARLCLRNLCSRSGRKSSRNPITQRKCLALKSNAATASGSSSNWVVTAWGMRFSNRSASSSINASRRGARSRSSPA